MSYSSAIAGQAWKLEIKTLRMLNQRMLFREHYFKFLNVHSDAKNGTHLKKSSDERTIDDRFTMLYFIESRLVQSATRETN